MKKLIGTALCAAMLVLPLSPAHAAVAGAGAEVTRDPSSNRFVVGGASYTVTPIVNSSYVTVHFQCYAVTGPDASQMRVGGCLLYKGSTLMSLRNDSSGGGTVAGASGSATFDPDPPEPIRVCWSFAATFIANSGQELGNQGCTTVHF